MSQVPGRLRCFEPGCRWWVDTTRIGLARASEQRDVHMFTKHRPAATFPPESKLFVLPPGSVQSDAAALDAARAAPAPILSWASSITFAADSPAGLVEKVRAWLAEMDGPTQTPGQEGTS